MALKTTRLTGLSFSALLLLAALQHMPGNRFALAIGVGGEDQPSASLTGIGDVGEPLGEAESTSHDIAKSSSGRTEPSLAGRSRTWPKEARTL
jgi:hypothetical protein